MTQETKMTKAEEKRFRNYVLMVGARFGKAHFTKSEIAFLRKSFIENNKKNS